MIPLFAWMLFAPPVEQLPVVKENPLPWLLPSRRICELNHQAANQWLSAVERQASVLGYGSYEIHRPKGRMEWEVAFLFHGGGGPHAEALRCEVEECKVLAHVWFLSLEIWDGEAWAELELRDVLGRDFWDGRMPSPIPYWRVPRAR